MIECPGCKRSLTDDTYFCPSCRYLVRPIAQKRPDGEEPRAASGGGRPSMDGVFRVPVSAGQTLQAGFSLWRLTAARLMWISALGTLGSVPLSLVSAATGFDPLEPSSYTFVTLAGIGLALVLGLPFFVGAAAGAFIDLAEATSAGGSSGHPGRAFVRGMFLFKRVAGTWALMGIVGVVAALPGIVALFAFDGTSLFGGALRLGAAAAGAFACAYLWIRWAPATAVAVVEGGKPATILLRSFVLTRGRFFRVLWVTAALFAVSFAARVLAAALGGFTAASQLLTIAVDVAFIGPVSSAVAFALYTGLARSGQ